MNKPSTQSPFLSIHPVFREFVEHRLLPAIDMTPVEFWGGLAFIVEQLTPVQRRLLQVRAELQSRIDEYHKTQRDLPRGRGQYLEFLHRIGYLKQEGEPFLLATRNVDQEISAIAGPQLVVPLSNARFAVNAANARWGSLYDALYGTDVIEQRTNSTRSGAYDVARGNAVISYVKSFLDESVPLRGASHADIVEYVLRRSGNRTVCRAVRSNGATIALANDEQFVAYKQSERKLALLFRNHGLHVELRIDPSHPVGRDDPAGISDVILESAITTIQDCEDSVAAIDAEDKVRVYENWLGLMEGTLSASFRKSGQTVQRRMNSDREYQSVHGNRLTLPGRSLMLVRNVGHLTTTNAVTDGNGDEIFEGILDALVTAASALVDIRRTNAMPNSRTGSIYIVKPKLHGPEEAAYTDQLMSMVENMIGLTRTTIKVGLMDEERRTTVNLHECIRALRSRLVFINTGFLDRTADEIRTSTYAGPMLPRELIKSQPWLAAYEAQNVKIGIECGLPGIAQIGKGMWAKTDNMREMMETKQAHPETGANCAWVPSPTAATLHAMHYHRVDVAARQRSTAKRPAAMLEQILTPPLMAETAVSEKEVFDELDNSTQSILGYVVRWIDQGIGCSKVPDITGVSLMEDRATLRISSQLIANWLLHGICTEKQVRNSFERTAKIVDQQNRGDPAYTPMCVDLDNSLAFNAACDLVLLGVSQPNGYTELILQRYRAMRKEAMQDADQTSLQK